MFLALRNALAYGLIETCSKSPTLPLKESQLGQVQLQRDFEMLWEILAAIIPVKKNVLYLEVKTISASLEHIHVSFALKF